MSTRPSCLRLRLATALGLLLVATVQAQGVYRCGNSYGPAPCAGGSAVPVDDARTADQRQQAMAAKKQDAQLARELAAERRAREQAAVGQRAARIGPSEAERAQAEAAQAKAQARAAAQRNKSNKPRKLGSA
jgi:flagellar biosynthesis GTPase FlhF